MPTATDCVPFTNCSIQVAKLPVALFETTQATKKRYAAEKRHTLLVRLSAHADNDGTNCWPGDKRLAIMLGCSERQIIRLRNDLQELGFVHADGFVRKPGSRTVDSKKWKLMLPPAAQKELGLNKPEVEAA